MKGQVTEHAEKNNGSFSCALYAMFVLLSGETVGRRDGGCSRCS